ncbi:MAG: hypothetical protein IPH60_10785 [Flavobacteriales bacterium]|nr:hypothetical protein [Flavobacteriales bacterium]
MAAGEVKGTVKEDAEMDAVAQDLKWLTPSVPVRGKELKALSAAEIKKLGFNFWWPKTMKPPFLDKKETAKLLTAVERKLR